jgi:hypothetical protein
MPRGDEGPGCGRASTGATLRSVFVGRRSKTRAEVFQSHGCRCTWMTVQAMNGRSRRIPFVHHSRAPITTTTRTAQAQQPLVQGHNNSGAKFRPHNACIASHETSHAILPATDAKSTDPVAPKQPTTRLTYIPHPATSGSAMRGQMLRWSLHTCSSHRSDGESVIFVPPIDDHVMSLDYSYIC